MINGLLFTPSDGCFINDDKKGISQIPNANKTEQIDIAALKNLIESIETEISEHEEDKKRAIFNKKVLNWLLKIFMPITLFLYIPAIKALLVSTNQGQIVYFIMYLTSSLMFNVALYLDIITQGCIESENNNKITAKRKLIEGYNEELKEKTESLKKETEVKSESLPFSYKYNPKMVRTTEYMPPDKRAKMFIKERINKE